MEKQYNEQMDSILTTPDGQRWIKIFTAVTQEAERDAARYVYSITTPSQHARYGWNSYHDVTVFVSLNKQTLSYKIPDGLVTIDYQRSDSAWVAK